MWNKNYVTKILTEGQVTGRYIPSKLEGGRRTPQPAIENFYPMIIPIGSPTYRYCLVTLVL